MKNIKRICIACRNTFEIVNDDQKYCSEKCEASVVKKNPFTTMSITQEVRHMLMDLKTEVYKQANITLKYSDLIKGILLVAIKHSRGNIITDVIDELDKELEEKS